MSMTEFQVGFLVGASFVFAVAFFVALIAYKEGEANGAREMLTQWRLANEARGYKMPFRLLEIWKPEQRQ